MKVSIALATYNGERWLREQLDSLAGQTLPPHELVVSDDQSADRTVEVVKEFAAGSSFPVRVIRNDVRLGCADNFINALRHCTGDVVAYCDQDDVWNADKLERCMAAMGSDTNVTLVHHDCEEVSSDLRPLGIVLRPTGNPTRMRGSGQYSVIGIPAQGCSMLLHRRTADAVLKYWPEAHVRYVARTGSRGDLSHDIATLHIASILGTVVYLSDVLILHRRHELNTWSPDLARSHSSSPLKLARRVAALEDYARAGKITASMYEEMAERAEADGDKRVARYLVRVAHRDLKGARLCAGRADLYSARSRLSRLARFAKMVSSGVYGGLDGALGGVRSAFKDLMVALAGPGALHLLEKVRTKLRLNFHQHELHKCRRPM
jgi:glycosyltransferase involved in cell wall biosynthesis